jgi:hypothetical protein
MYTLYIIADIQNDTGEEIKHQGETYRQKRRVDKEKANF